MLDIFKQSKEHVTVQKSFIIFTFPIRKYTNDSLGTICFNSSNSSKASCGEEKMCN